MNSAETTWTAMDVAEYLHIPKHSVYTMVSQGRLPYYKLSRKMTRFKKSDIDKWLAEVYQAGRATRRIPVE
jgi:excisionase family DNA binding protein